MRSHYVGELTPEMDGQSVTLAGWVHEIRDFGQLKFILLRDKTGVIQLTIKKKECPPELSDIAHSLVKETSILCTGLVKNSKAAKNGIEILPNSLQVIGKVLKQVPFEVTGKVPAELDVRLDHRFIDLRRVETTSIFQIRSEVQRAFREKLLELQFQEINPPTLVSTSTEGGSDLFEVQYFEKKAFLAQSPQLYKQLAVMGGMDKVFMVQPIFRAEKHNTTMHLNEVTQMDAEMGFATDKEALEVLEKVFIHVLSSVKEKCGKQLTNLEMTLNVPKAIPSITYDKAITALQANGAKIEWGDDFSKEQERELPGLLGDETFFLTEWPTKIRAFYSMPREENEEKCRAYDLMYKGLEMASGAQRIHVPDMLIKQLKARGLHPSEFEYYIDAFRYGAIPHAGWSIGAERLTMQLTGVKNIRECSLFPRDRHRITP